MHKITSMPGDGAPPDGDHTNTARQRNPGDASKIQTRGAVVGAGYTGLAAAQQLGLHCPKKKLC